MKRLKFLLLVVVIIAAMSAAFAPAAAALAQSSVPCTGTIAAIAICINGQTGEFSTLIAALVYTELVGAVADPGAQLTVFAPTDAAFRMLGLNKDNISSLPKEAVADILLYHVAAGERFASSFRRPTFLRMLNGDFTFVYTFFGRVFIAHSGGLSRVIQGNVDASNGVIHVINRVLLPPN